MRRCPTGANPIYMRFGLTRAIVDELGSRTCADRKGPKDKLVLSMPCSYQESVIVIFALLAYMNEFQINPILHMPDWRCLQFDKELLERGGTWVNPNGLCLNLSIIILTIP